MRPAASIQPHLSDEELREWAHARVDQATYRRRLAIWMTHHARLHAATVADLLGVSRPSVWKWIGEYNRYALQGWNAKDVADGGGRFWVGLKKKPYWQRGTRAQSRER